MGLMMKGQGWGPGPQRWIPTEAKAPRSGRDPQAKARRKRRKEILKDYFSQTDGRKGDSIQSG